MKTNYNIGLDIGTSSLGWAIINSDTFKVVRKGNKAMWGVRLFDPAVTAEERRKYRGTRRRYDRRRARIKLLQNEFSSEIIKIDKDFYTKMKELFYRKNDIENKTITISKEEKRSVKEYNKKYPTIYHLRKKLVENPEKEDIRLIYLAIHHIIKYRGNFLYGTDQFKVDKLDIKKQLGELFPLIIELCADIEIAEEEIDTIDLANLELGLLSISKNDKKIIIEKELSKIFSKKVAKEFTKMFVGDKFSVSTLFEKELEEDIKISFKGSDYDDNFDKIEKGINDEAIILTSLKEIYDTCFLKSLFNGSDEKSLSSLMVKRYNDHHDDLKILKSIYKNDRDLYNEMFKGEKCQYKLYIQNKTDNDTFFKTINKDIEEKLKLSDNLLLNNEIMKKMENGILLPKITEVDNGKFPFQLNKDELISIIKNQGKYYPFLLDKVTDEETGKETYKIVRLLEFRIPYYVGPLNDVTSNKNKKNANAWMVKKEDNISINPYNFKSIVDLESSAEKFIERMIGNCTYLTNKKVIASNTILYSKFKVLNELKQIKVGSKGREERVPHKIQKQIYEELFLKEPGSITDKKFKKYLMSSGNFNMYDELSVIGYSADNKFSNNMQSYIDFFGVDGIFNNTSYSLDDADNIIQLITIFEDKDLLVKKVSREYSKLDISAIKKISSKKYKGWSNLSKELLTEIYYCDKKTGINKSVLTLIEETTENFMQILCNKQYKIEDKIDEINQSNIGTKINYSVVENLVTSPSNKKGIYQALKLIEELIEYMGYEPKSIIFEMARGEGQKKRKDDRKKLIENIYNKNKKEIDNYNKLSRELKNKEKIDADKLFLYFIQEGKSLYSDTCLDIDHLSEYEIDHIIPQSLIKDNSIDNKALVLREENQAKAASFVLPEQFRTIYMKKWWQHLKKVGLISIKKYNNLCRYKYDEKTIEGFIGRQLVETRQICKHVANIVKNYHEESSVIYLPAAINHNYRQKFHLYKFRNINDYHHAHDAYLTAVLGEYKTNYLKQSIDFDKLKEINKYLYENKRYSDLSSGYVINSLDNDLNNFYIFYDENGEVKFDVNEFNKNIEETIYRNDILISRKAEKNTGKFYNETIYSPKKEKEGPSIKDNLNNYGNYSSVKIAYFCCVECSGIRKIIGIPIIIDVKSKRDNQIKLDYIAEHINKSAGDIKIIRDNIYMNTSLIYKGQEVRFIGYSVSNKLCELGNVTELKIPKENMEKWKETLNYVFNDSKTLLCDEELEKNIDNIVDWLLNKSDVYPLQKNSFEKLGDCYKKAVLGLLEKKKFLNQIINLYNTGKTNCNLSAYKMSTAFGKMNGKTINDGILVDRSISGVKEKHYEF